MNFSELKNSSFALSSDEMKEIKGSGTCGYAITIETDRGIDTVIGCGVSKQDALNAFDMGVTGSHWCCDSCGSTSYCG